MHFLLHRFFFAYFRHSYPTTSSLLNFNLGTDMLGFLNKIGTLYYHYEV